MKTLWVLYTNPSASGPQFNSHQNTNRQIQGHLRELCISPSVSASQLVELLVRSFRMNPLNILRLRNSDGLLVPLSARTLPSNAPNAPYTLEVCDPVSWTSVSSTSDPTAHANHCVALHEENDKISCNCPCQAREMAWIKRLRQIQMRVDQLERVLASTNQNGPQSNDSSLASSLSDGQCVESIRLQLVAIDNRLNTLAKSTWIGKLNKSPFW